MATGDHSPTSVSTPPILACQALTKNFSTGRQTSTILADVNLAVDRGGFVTILGQSGGGKISGQRLR